jgi:hypothetical protein
MAITKERFQQGMTYDEYKAQMKSNRERLQEFELSLELPAEHLHYFSQLDQQLQVLVLTEDWCNPAIVNLPMLGRLAEESGKLNLRIFLRDQNPDIMDLYLREGIHRTIPTVVFFTESFHQLGVWAEFPAKIIPLKDQMVEEFKANDPEYLAALAAGTPPGEMPEAVYDRLKEAFLNFHAETRQFSNNEAIREMRELVEQGLAAGS